MKLRFALGGAIFALMAVGCSAAPPAAIPTPTRAPTLTPTQHSSGSGEMMTAIANASEMTAQAMTPIPPLSERPGHVFLADGSGLAGYLYRAALQTPTEIAWGPDGYLYIADWTGRRVVRYALDGTADDPEYWRDPQVGGAWSHDGPRYVAFAPDGTMVVGNHGTIWQVAADGTFTQLNGVEGSPVGGLLFGPDGTLYYTDRGQGLVRRWLPEGRSEVVASGIPNAEVMAFGLDGTLYVSEMAMNTVVKVDVASGQVSDFLAVDLGNDPIYLAVDSAGDIWVRGITRLYRVSPDGALKPYVIDGQTYNGGEYFGLRTAGGIAFDSQGGLWIANYNSMLQRLNPPEPGQEANGMTLSVVEPAAEMSDMGVGPDGTVYAYNENTRQMLRISPAGDVEVLLQREGGGRVAVAVELGWDAVPGYAAG